MSQTNPVETFVDAFFEKLIESNAVNYLQETYGIEYPVLRGGKVDVTVILNYPDKPTPHELLLEAKAEVERLKRNIRVLEKASGLVIPDGRDIPVEDYPLLHETLERFSGTKLYMIKGAVPELKLSEQSGRIVGMPEEMATPYYGYRLADETGECMVGP